MALWQALLVESVNVAFGHRLWWVDAFTGEAERGNPAVVVLLERLMPDDELQQIAFELGAILAGTDIVAVLHDDSGAVARGRVAVLARLKGSLAPSAKPQPSRRNKLASRRSN